MADSSISNLPAATTPLDGTEVLPIVDGGVTQKVSVANLTAGRAISATQVTVTTGNIIIRTAGKGIDFDPAGSGAAANLLDDYEEGTWTPTRNNFTEVLGSGAITSSGIYTKTGNIVHCHCDIVCSGGATIAGISGTSYIGGMPFLASVGAGGVWVDTTIGGLGAIWANTGNLIVIKTSFGATSSTFMLDVTYTI